MAVPVGLVEFGIVVEAEGILLGFLGLGEGGIVEVSFVGGDQTQPIATAVEGEHGG
jgi:hypothetical protein